MEWIDKIFYRIYGGSVLSNVRLSKKGLKLLNNKPLASKVVKAIIQNGNELHCGKEIKVEHNGKSILISSATNQNNKNK